MQYQVVRGLTRAALNAKIQHMAAQGWQLEGAVQQEFGMLGLFNRRFAATMKRDPQQQQQQQQQANPYVQGWYGGQRALAQAIEQGELSAAEALDNLDRMEGKQPMT